MNYHFNWPAVENWCIKIRRAVEDKSIDMVVGITRGGLVPATMISYRFDVPVRSLQWQLYDGRKTRDFTGIVEILHVAQNAVLIVDDVYNTGTTLNQVYYELQRMNERLPEALQIDVYCAACIKRKETNCDFQLVVGREIEGFESVSFPWQ